MLFSEIYGSYFNVVAAVLSEASAGCLTDRRMTELIQAKAFAESSLSIPAALKKEAWPLLDQELKTAVSYTHLDVYKRQALKLYTGRMRSMISAVGPI